MSGTDERNTYLKQMEKRIADMEETVEKLKAAHKGEKPEHMEAVLRSREELLVRWDDMMARMKQARDSGAEAWKFLESGLESAFDELRRAIEKATSALRK